MMAGPLGSSGSLVHYTQQVVRFADPDWLIEIEAEADFISRLTQMLTQAQ
jgi:hypothetical protein